MDPRTGDYVSREEFHLLPPAERERFSVEVRGTEEDVQRISESIKSTNKAVNRKKNKAARKARRNNR